MPREDSCDDSCRIVSFLPCPFSTPVKTDPENSDCTFPRGKPFEDELELEGVAALTVCYCAHNRKSTSVLRAATYEHRPYHARETAKAQRICYIYIF